MQYHFRSLHNLQCDFSHPYARHMKHPSELIATSTIGCGVAWSNQFLQELGHNQLTIEIGGDVRRGVEVIEVAKEGVDRDRECAFRIGSENEWRTAIFVLVVVVISGGVMGNPVPSS